MNKLGYILVSCRDSLRRVWTKLFAKHFWSFDLCDLGSWSLNM